MNKKPVFSFHFIDGAYLEIKCHQTSYFVVNLRSLDDPELSLECKIANNQWVRSPHRYFVRWQINVYDETGKILLFRHNYDNQGKRVYVSMESKALGDTLAWMPAIEAFRLRHHCHIICSTFINSFFRKNYPEIEFVEPGEVVRKIYAQYRLGWFYKDSDSGEVDFTRNVHDFRQQPMAQSAYDILGLEYAEIKPRIDLPDWPRPIHEPYVCIGFHATAQAKYWNNPEGWNEVVRFLRKKGYRVVLLSKEGQEYMGNRVPRGVKCLPKGPLEVVINYLKHARLFIGVGSGLSWLAWATGCKTCLISGFSYPYAEMKDCIRIFPKDSVCSGCFNRYRLVQSDWNWCPDYKNTPRMFECTRSLSANKVIEAIESYL